MALNTSINKIFKNAFEEDCFQLIVNAYQSSINEKTIQLNWEENDISAELQRHMHADSMRITLKISTNVESHIPKNSVQTKGFASKYPRIDFRLTTFGSMKEYEYFLEAKNLRTSDSALKRRYIDTGISNFTSGKYPNGSLLGYLLEGTPKDAVKGINSLLSRDSRNNEFLNFTNNKFLDTYCESNHPTIGVLKHLIFDFTSMAN